MAQHISFAHLIIMLLLLIIRPSSSSSLSSSRVIRMDPASLINAICEYNDQPDACVKLLSSLQEAKNADLEGIGAIALILAHYLTMDTLYIIRYLSGQNTGDDRLREILNTCNKLYWSAKHDIDDAMDNLLSADYVPMNMNSWSAGESGIVCEEEFARYPSRPSPLSSNNEWLSSLGQIAAAVSNMLLSPSP